jgi:hypothetical protein
MAKSYVKALYDYHSGEIGDLNFNAGDIIQVVNQIDENWVKGKHDGTIGLFPANFVEPVAASADNEKAAPTSSIENAASIASGKTVVANETYISGDDGVLTFFRGDELTFLSRVDEYWCQGSFANEVGLFPAHMVDGLDDGLPSSQINDSPSSSPTVIAPVTEAAQPSSLQRHTTQAHPHEPHAKTLFEFKGLSDFELSFPEGEIVLLTKDIDEEWFEGSYNGNTGIFPKGFVEVLKPLPEGLHKSKVPETECKTADVPYAIAVYPFVGETSSELSFREGETIFLHHWVSPEWIQGECNDRIGIFPSTFVQIEKALPQDFKELSEGVTHVGDGTLFGGEGGPPHTQEEMVYSVFKTGDKALAIYSYSTDMEGDLRLEVGDLIWIEQIIDEEWVLGRKGDDVGLCPAVFLELQPDELGLEQQPGLTTTTPKIQLISEVPCSVKLPTPPTTTPPTTTPPTEKPAPVTDTRAQKPTTLPLATKPPLAPKPLISPKPDFLKKPVKPLSLPVKPVLPPKPVTPTEKSPGFSKSNGECFVLLNVKRNPHYLTPIL